MQHQFKNRDTFYFAELEMEDMETDVQNLNRKEAWQYSDFPTKIVKENFDIYIYTDFLCKIIQCNKVLFISLIS